MGQRRLLLCEPSSVADVLCADRRTLPGPGTGAWGRKSLPSVSLHHRGDAGFRAAAEKAARRVYSLREKSSERNIFNVIVSQLVF